MQHLTTKNYDSENIFLTPTITKVILYRKLKDIILIEDIITDIQFLAHKFWNNRSHVETKL